MIKAKNCNLKHIPGNTGYPIFGNLFGIFKNQLQFALEQYKNFGKVYKFKLLAKKFVSLNGPEANEFVLMDQNNIFSNSEGLKFLFDPFFKGALVLKDFEEHKIHRKALLPAFTPERIAGYIPIITATVNQELLSIPSSGQLKIYPFIKNLILKISATMLMGVDLTSNIKDINKAFINTTVACASIIKLNLPGTAYRRGIYGRAYLTYYLQQLIQKKILHPGNDMLSHLINTRFEDNTKLTNQEIIDHMIFMLAAAHDTTTLLVSSILYELAQHPFWQDKVYQELVSILTTEEDLNIETLDKLTALDLVMHECLRLFPSVAGINRKAIKAFSFAGYEVPKDTLISINISLSHMLPQYWSKPECFDPERFNNSRAEHKQHRFLYLPFGGGAHKCIGMKLAQFEVKAIIAKLLLKYQFNVINGYKLKMKLKPIPTPADDLPLIISKR